jgi:hypothetical protein
VRRGGSSFARQPVTDLGQLSRGHSRNGTTRGLNLARYNLWRCAFGATTRTMCRNIRTLFNFEPPATDEEVRAASLQFVRKLSGFNSPSRANEAAFNRAVEQVTEVARQLVDELVTTAPPRNREEMAAAARARAAKRFGRAG